MFARVFGEAMRPLKKVETLPNLLHGYSNVLDPGQVIQDVNAQEFEFANSSPPTHTH